MITVIVITMTNTLYATRIFFIDNALTFLRNTYRARKWHCETITQNAVSLTVLEYRVIMPIDHTKGFKLGTSLKEESDSVIRHDRIPNIYVSR